MSLVAAFVAGGALGASHALEADHLAAVATLVDGDASHPGAVGASWGVGHALPIAVLGLLALLFGLRLPDTVTRLFELGVGLVLVYLGVRLLGGVFRHREHAHGPHPLHGHLDVGRLSVGGRHTHLDGDSLLVGALHGVAGSGVLVVALVSTAPTVATAAAFLVAFACCSILTMGAVSALWGRTVPAARRWLRGVAGALGVAVGLLLLVERAGVW